MIRLAKKEDMEDILTMSEKFVAEAPYTVPYDRETSIETITGILESAEDLAVLIVAEEDGKVVGMFAGLLTPLFYNKNYKQSVEWFWWVEEDYRKSSIGKDLFEAYEDWAKFYGAHQISCCTMSSNKSLVGWFEKKGYTNREFFCTKEVV